MRYTVCCILLCCCLAACAPRNVPSEEVSSAVAWDVFRNGTDYWLTALYSSSWQCSDCDFTAEGRLKSCRECVPRAFADMVQARRESAGQGNDSGQDGEAITGKTRQTGYHGRSWAP